MSRHQGCSDEFTGAVKLSKRTEQLFLSLLLGVSVTSQAVTLPDPGAVQQLDQERLKRFQQEEALRKGAPATPVITTPGEGAAPVKGSDVKNIAVRRFEVDPSEFLSAAEIESVLASYTGRNVSLNELFEAVARINGLYDAKNIKTARAILSPQEISYGVVKIRLVEARLGVLRIDGLEHLKPEFVSERIHMQPGDIVSVTQLETDLVRFNSLYETKLRADIKAGARVGTTDIILDAQEPKRTQLTTFVDNAGRDTVGEQRIGGVFRSSNLLGVSDSIQLVAVSTSGSKSYGISYAMPVTANDLRLDVSFNNGSIKLVDGPFVPLNITGTSKDLTAGLTQPFAIDLNHQWAVYGRLSSRNSISKFSGFTQQSTNLEVFSTGVSGEAHYNDHSWSLDNSLNFGLNVMGGSQKFTYYRANAARVDRLSKNIQLQLRGGLQYSQTEILPSSEQFQVGGLYTVRGFSEGLLSGRNGYFASVELRAALKPTPATFTTSVSPGVQTLVFLDHGAALPFRPGLPNTSNDHLTSAGVGLVLDFGSQVSARMTAAFPLKKNPGELRQRNPKIHFGLNISWL